jgi:hypothetical protein
VALLPACSFILDFDEPPPADASIDAPYTQAECDFKEPNDSVAEAAMIDATEAGPAAICAPTMGGAEDVDYYKFTVSSATVTVGIAFKNRPGGDLDIKLLDSAGGMVAQSRGFGDGETIVCPGASPSCPMLAAGDYILQVFPAVAGSVNSYTISIVP